MLLTYILRTLVIIFFLFYLYLRKSIESKYHRCFFLFYKYRQISFQNLNSDNNTQEMATGSSYKDEIHPFAPESKCLYLNFFERIEFYYKARTVPKTTTSVPVTITGYNCR